LEEDGNDTNNNDANSTVTSQDKTIAMMQLPERNADILA
jgi:hypothetical protein